MTTIMTPGFGVLWVALAGLISTGIQRSLFVLRNRKYRCCQMDDALDDERLAADRMIYVVVVGGCKAMASVQGRIADARFGFAGSANDASVMRPVVSPCHAIQAC